MQSASFASTSDRFWATEDRSTEANPTPLKEAESLPDPFDYPYPIEPPAALVDLSSNPAVDSSEYLLDWTAVGRKFARNTAASSLDGTSHAFNSASEGTQLTTALHTPLRRSGRLTSPILDIPSPIEVSFSPSPKETLPITPIDSRKSSPSNWHHIPESLAFVGHRNTVSDASDYKNLSGKGFLRSRLTKKNSSGDIRDEQSTGKRVQGFFSPRGPSFDPSQARAHQASVSLAPPLRPLSPMESTTKSRSSGWKLGFGRKNSSTNPPADANVPKSRFESGARSTPDFDALLGHGLAPRSGKPQSDVGSPGPSSAFYRVGTNEHERNDADRGSWNTSEADLASNETGRTPDANVSSVSSVSVNTSSVSGRRSKFERLTGDAIPVSVGSVRKSLSADRVHTAQSPISRGNSHGGSTVDRASPSSLVQASRLQLQQSTQPPSNPGLSPRSESRDSPVQGFGGRGSGSARASPTELHKDSGADCPVCLEPLSYRLADERPHVIPSCGHALHNACFTAVYGPATSVLAAQRSQLQDGTSGTPSAPGMCGICRKPIVLGMNPDEGFRKQNKLMGVEDEDGASSQGIDDLQSTLGDDQLDANGPRTARSHAQLRSDTASIISASAPTFVSPFIKARAEYKTIYRNERSGPNTKQNVVCVVSIEIPSRRSQNPSPAEDRDTNSGYLGTIHDQVDDEVFETQSQGRHSGGHPLTREHLHLAEAQSTSSGRTRTNSGTDDRGRAESQRGAYSERARSPFERRDSSARSHDDSDEDAGFSFGATPAAAGMLKDRVGPVTESPYRAVMDDLQARIADWKGHSMDHFGPLVLHDYLSVRQDTVVREFYVYLFREALLCVSEERKKGLARFIPGATGISTATAGTDGAPLKFGSKAALKLKGRIYLRHIRRVIDSATDNSLSIKMDDDNLDHFVLCFKTGKQLELWRQRMSDLIDQRRKARAQQQQQQQPQSMPSNPPPSGPLPPSEAPPDYNGVIASNRGGVSQISHSSGKAGSIGPTTPNSPMPTAVSRRSLLASRRISAQPVPVVTEPQHQQWSASGGLDPSHPPPPMLPHAPVDLVIMVSVPAVSGAQTTGSVTSSSALKLRLIRSSLEFIAQHLGPRDRIAVITYTVGIDGEVRRTALLNPSRDQSRNTLQQFIASIGQPWTSEHPDPFREDLAGLGGTSDRTDTITAVNVGLDIVLKRKTKNPITGMLLIHDTVDGPRSGGQMDLVKARAEAAKVAIHCFGYGKSHDPSSLWLISHSTRGSYTFVKEWYELRECLAGCIGSLMSVALTDLKVHISVPDDNHFRIRKVTGVTGAIIGSTGKTVDVDVNELHFGEKREFFIELDLDFNALVTSMSKEASASGGNSQRGEDTVPSEARSTATDDFMQRMGLPSLSLADADLYDASLEQPMIEEVAVLEANAGFKDPMTGVSVPSLSNPTVLTVEVDARNSDPAAEGSPSVAAALADPIVTRRRLEILVSDMITHSLVVSSRKNYAQALKILSETRRIVDTVVQAIPTGEGGVAARQGSVDSMNASAGPTLVRRVSSTSRGPRRLREAQNRRTSEALVAILEDLDALVDGLELQHTSFDRDLRNFGAQQAMVLRDQLAWTSRSDTEYRHFVTDNGPPFTARSAAFSAFVSQAS